MGIAAPHRNRYLFSDHYLENLLPDDPHWSSALAQAEDVLVWLQDLYTGEQDQLPDYNESQLEQYWFRPIFEQLGHVFELQASVPGLDDYAKRPDYVFFPDENARHTAVGLQNEADYAAEALAVGEVKRWDTPLGKKRRGGEPSFENQNPSWQIDYYVRITGLDWGILTNGRLWRLVHRDSSQRLDIYYEVDLVDLLSRGEPGPLRYFTLFFRQAAFRPDAQGRIFLDGVLVSSSAYAVALEEDVEDNIYQSLEQLMQGFLDLPANALGPDDLRDVYDNSLYLLYRLLFILYGESRGLLPMDNDAYRDHFSLEAIKRAVAEGNVPRTSMTTVVWGRLHNLFRIVNGDNADLNRSLGVPRYDGRLFDPHQHPFLEEKEVGDGALVEAIDLVSRRKSKTGREFVDYRTLSIRHLGSIYEGLLEYRPHLAEEPMVAVGDEWLAARAGPEDGKVIARRKPGQVYLVTNRGERKASGSYYTPQYIVEYIVEHSIGPLIEEATERVKDRAKKAKSKAERAEAEQSLIDEVLSLKVLDPAMGSGHFLVEATDHLALALATDPYIETAETPEEDLTYWKRRVVERCIYGVDKNPLAVELAKLSLWLATVAVDRPLSFLDHHLKCGDSLIGATVQDLGAAPPSILSKKARRRRAEEAAAGARQVNLFETRLAEKLPEVIGHILEITELESKDYDTVRAKEAADQAVRKLKAPFEAVADLWTSAYFDNDFTPGDYDDALGVIGQPDTLLRLEAVERARWVAQERRFFHWELAFPEVFYDERGRHLEEWAGFDAVVGNPPYVSFGLGRTGKLPSCEEGFYRATFERSAEYKISVYALFIEQALAECRPDGYASLIVPDSFLTGRYFSKVREHLLRDSILQYIVAFNHDFWRSGDVGFPTIFVTRKRHGERAVRDVSPQFKYARIDEPEQLSGGVDYVGQSQTAQLDNPRMRFWLVEEAPGNLIGKLRETGQTLGVLLSMHHGIRSKVGRAEIVAKTRLGPDWRKAIASSGEIGRHSIAPERHFIRVDPEILFSGGWDPQHIEQDKVLIRRTGDALISVVDVEGYYHTNALIYGVPTTPRGTWSLFALSSVLNSRLMNFYYQQTTMKVGRALPQVEIDTLEHLPIRRIDFATPAEERRELLADGIAGAAEWIECAEKRPPESAKPPKGPSAALSDSNVARWLDDRLSAEPEQADVIHDLLAHLAERMTAMHKEKQERAEAFWVDLEGITDPDKFEELSERGKQGRSLWKHAACRSFVEEGSYKTHHLAESLGWNKDCFKAFVKMLAGSISNLSKLIGVYRDHHAAYRQLVQRIEATDRLIDLIVYRLYGLTEEEIAVVELR
jgi:type I restriction-modification system DNA methylase subunit